MPAEDLADGFTIEVPYLGGKVGRATWSGSVPSRLEYRAPWHVFAPGDVGEQARSAGGAAVATLMAVFLMFPVAGILLALDTLGEDRERVAPTAGSVAWSCPSADEVSAVAGQPVEPDPYSDAVETSDGAKPGNGEQICSYLPLGGDPETDGSIAYLFRSLGDGAELRDRRGFDENISSWGQGYEERITYKLDPCLGTDDCAYYAWPEDGAVTRLAQVGDNFFAVELNEVSGDLRGLSTAMMETYVDATMGTS